MHILDWILVILLAIPFELYLASLVGKWLKKAKKEQTNDPE